ncbi:MAG: type II secretion system F family protein [Henriciella sp.]|nr:type II secretion system F family protein [Henriciella sp.]
MPIYKYKGVASDGTQVSGKIEALEEREALRQLQTRQIRVFDIAKAKDAKNDLKTGQPSSNDYYQLLKQFSVLVDAEVSVLEGLQSLKGATKHKRISSQLDKVSQKLRAGITLGDAMAEEMPEFPPLVFNLVKLGEKTGRLGSVMSMLADQLSLQEKMKKELRDALTYPTFLLVVGIVAVVFMFYVVVPRFSSMIGDSRDSLPLIADTVFSISEFMTGNPMLVLVGLGGILGLALLVWRSKSARESFMRLGYRIPVLGGLMQTADMSNWTRTIGISVDARSHLLEAVELANQSIGDPTMKSEFQNVTRDLRSGLSLDEALKKVERLDPLVLSLVSTGVKSGRLAEMLLIATDNLDEDVSSKSGRLGKLAEPIAILVISLIVGTVVIALVTSMTSLYDVSL